MEREGWEPGENELQPSPLKSRQEHDSGCSSKSTFLHSVSSLPARLARCLSVWWVLWTSTSCLLGEKVSGCEGTHFDHIKPWMWLGHTHKSGVLFEDGVIKLFPHILILWSFGRERSRGVKRQTGHTGKMLWVSCLSFIWVERVFLTVELQSKVPVLWNLCLHLEWGWHVSTVTPTMHYSELVWSAFFPLLHMYACSGAVYQGGPMGGGQNKILVSQNSNTSSFVLKI